MPRKILNDSSIASICNALKRCCARSGNRVERFGKPLHHDDAIIATNAVAMVEVNGFESRYPRFLPDLQRRHALRRGSRAQAA